MKLSELIGKGYKGFWHSQERYKVVKGGRASKKSCTAALWFIVNMMRHYRQYGVKPCLLVIRRYFNTHKNSTRAQLIWAIKRLGVKHLWKIPKGEHTLTYIPSGQVILFRGMDDPDSITSITVDEGQLVWCWIEEAYQIHNEADFDKLDMSFRGETPCPLFKQLTLTFNPWADTTWIKKRFFDKPDENTFTLTTNYTCNEFLGDDDRAIFENMKINNPRRYAIEGLGEWGVIAGNIYKSYLDDPAKHHVPEIPKDEKIGIVTIGLDYGTGDGTGDASHAKKGKTVMEVTAITKGFGKVYCVDEFHFKADYDADEVVEWVIECIVKIKSWVKETAKSRNWSSNDIPDLILYAEWAGSNAINKKINKEILKKGITGIRIANAYKATILERIEAAQILLGENRLFFTDKVPKLKESYKTALWDAKEAAKGKIVRLDDGLSCSVDELDTHEYSISSWISYLLAYSGKSPDTYKNSLKE